MTETQPKPTLPLELLELRARSLAVIALTDHPQVEVTREQPSSPRLDILAYLRREGKTLCCQFGIKVEAGLVHEHSTLVAPKLSREQNELLRETPFPLCLFFFTVDNSQGYWRWLQEPKIDPFTGAVLRFHETGRLAPLSLDEVSKIVQAISKWYDARK